jgi:hypothetical protein
VKEITGNLWDYYDQNGYPVCITTNGSVKKNGEAVMGRGCAKEAMDRYRGFPKMLGDRIKAYGNKPHLFHLSGCRIIITFPVKVEWHYQANKDLIRSSAMILKHIVDRLGIEKIVIPRPGCGNGQLKWEEVKPILEECNWDDRFLVITKEEK